MQIQLDFFEEKTEIEILRDQIRIMKDSNEKLRKSLYARHGELAKKYIELHDRMRILEHGICKNDYDYKKVGSFF